MILRKKKHANVSFEILVEIKVIFMVNLGKGSENTEDGLYVVFGRSTQKKSKAVNTTYMTIAF